MLWLGLEAIDLVLRVDNLASGGVRAKGYAIVLEAIVATKVILRAQALCTLENTATFLSSKGCNDISASPLHKLDQSSMLIHRIEQNLHDADITIQTSALRSLMMFCSMSDSRRIATVFLAHAATAAPGTFKDAADAAALRLAHNRTRPLRPHQPAARTLN